MGPKLTCLNWQLLGSSQAMEIKLGAFDGLQHYTRIVFDGSLTQFLFDECFPSISFFHTQKHHMPVDDQLLRLF